MQEQYTGANGVRSGHGEKQCGKSAAAGDPMDPPVYGTADEESAIRVAAANGRMGIKKSASARCSLFWAVKCDRPPVPRPRLPCEMRKASLLDDFYLPT